MADIVNFPNGNEEECCECPYCDLRNEYLSYFIDCDSVGEMNELLNEVIQEARVLAEKQLLKRMIVQNVEHLEYLENGCCDKE